MLRFAGFELDQERAELRGPDGKAIRLRRKTFAMLYLLAENSGRVVSKQELMEAVWPNVHVGEDSLFQCVREIRTALADDRKQLIKVVSGRGYLFDAEVSNGSVDVSAVSEAMPGPIKRHSPLFGLRGRVAAATIAGFSVVAGFAIAALIFAPDLIFGRTPPSIAVMPIVESGNDPQAMSMAAGVTDLVTDGLTEIEDLRVVAPQWAAASVTTGRAPARAADADLVLSGALQRGTHAWVLEARMTDAASGEVKWSTSVSVGIEGADPALQQSRLAAGLGHEVAIRINALLDKSGREAGSGSLAGKARVVIEQAMASINQTSRERFATAQAMLEKALAEDQDNVDLQVALASLQTRGIQMVWYDPAESEAAQAGGRSLLERALRTKPGSIPVLEAYCRFLTATNNFAESLVACARVLSFDPWHGSALYQMGLTQLYLGRFEDALATFKQADRFDTPIVSRWTWLLGIGWANLFLGHDEEALPWLEKSITITPASGRPHLLLAAAYQRLGRTEEAKAALERAMELRPGSTARNISSPTDNASPAFSEAGRELSRTLIEVGLPEN